VLIVSEHIVVFVEIAELANHGGPENERAAID
jgi:hypothetical protein